MRSGTTLAQKQSLPLKAKVILTKNRIREWHDHWEGDIYVSVSGGKQSSVLARIVQSMYPKTPAVFCNTGLEYPGVRHNALQTNNIVTIKPKLTFKEVIDRFGYPIATKEVAQFVFETRTGKSEKLKQIRIHGNKWGRGKIPEKWKFLLDAPFCTSHKCCDHLKKYPFRSFEKETGLHGLIGTTAVESSRRSTDWIRYGCNAFDAKRPLSRPLSIWTDEDVWQYIKDNNITYAPEYDLGYQRTGCMFCCFGVHLEEEPNRFQRMKITHPAQWNYCIHKLGLKEVLDYMGVPYDAGT